MESSSASTGITASARVAHGPAGALLRAILLAVVAAAAILVGLPAALGVAGLRAYGAS